MNIEEGQLVKGGEAVVRANIHRSPIAGRLGVGFLFTVWVHHYIEDFFRSLSAGETVDVAGLGRYWTEVEKQALVTYHLPKQMGIQPLHGDYYSLDRPGQPLMVTEDGGIRDGMQPVTINLSPIRLMHASDGAGVTFGVRGVYTLPQLIKIRDKFIEASEKFYIEYMKPMDLSMTLSTQNIEVNVVTSQMNRG